MEKKPKLDRLGERKWKEIRVGKVGIGIMKDKKEKRKTFVFSINFRDVLVTKEYMWL